MLLGASYSKMGPRFRQKAGEAYARVVREYPLSTFADEAKKRLTEMEMVVPEADPVAYNRMKYELENRQKPSLTSSAFGIFKSGPDVRTAAKSGTPAMEPLRPTIPASVPIPGEAGAAGFQGDVSVQQVGPNSALDTQPDARQGRTGEQGAAQAEQPANGAATGQTQPAAAAQGAAATPDQATAPPAKGKKAPKQEKKKK
jgi:hypothetical protein